MQKVTWNIFIIVCLKLILDSILSKSLIDKWQSQSLKKSFGFLDKPSKIKSKDHNTAQQIHEEVFSEFDCLDCANCCKSIPPIVSKRDVKRISKHLQMSPSEFEDRYTKTDSDGDRVLNASPCRFLESDNKCSIYEVRPAACRQYPHSGDHLFFENLSHHKRNAKYCPALFEILKRMEEIVR